MKHKEDSTNPKDPMKSKHHPKHEAHPKESPAEAPAGEAAPDTAPGAEPSETEQLKAEVTRLKDQMLRAMAEVENTRRRTQRDLEDGRRYAISTFAQDLLNVLDNFYRTEEHLPQDLEGLEPSMRSLVQGIHLTKNELIKVFESHGIRRINPERGEAFDHNLHQAITQVQDASLPPNSIAQVVQAGYTIHDRLLRPAMVSVTVALEGPAA
jgi:molecular chaperone GrpE